MINCPDCDKEAELMAEVKPDGWIGCVCKFCGKAYITKDPEKGWKCYSTIPSETAHDLKVIHGIDVYKEMFDMAKVEYDKS